MSNPLYPTKTPAQLPAAVPQRSGLLLHWLAGAMKVSTITQLFALLGKSDVGLGNVDNTADADKPVSTAQQAAINGRQASNARLAAIAALTGAAGSFIRWTGAATAVMQAIVGTVSQASGVPTGAIIEQGSNANGRYVRYADGTQICFLNTTVSLALSNAYGSLYQTSWAWTFPAAFSASPTVVAGAQWSTGAGWGGIAATPLTTAASLRIIDIQQRAADSTLINAVAIGRWF